MELHLRIIGVILVLLATAHLIFPRYFKWKSELSGLSLVNRQMVLVHTLFIALGIFLMGVLCLASPEDIVNTTLGKRISLGLGLFWLCRLFVQFFGFSKALWKGKRFETTIHILFSFLWTYISLVFLTVYFYQ